MVAVALLTASSIAVQTSSNKSSRQPGISEESRSHTSRRADDQCRGSRGTARSRSSGRRIETDHGCRSAGHRKGSAHTLWHRCLRKPMSVSDGSIRQTPSSKRRTLRTSAPRSSGPSRRGTMARQCRPRSVDMETADEFSRRRRKKRTRLSP